MNFKKNHERFLTKTLDTNVTSNDKSKSSIIISNPKKHFINNISYTLKKIEYDSHILLKKKYNILPKQYNLIQLDNFIIGKYCRSLAKFKEKLMFNYREEFIKKTYKIKEIKKKLPLFYEFYKSYLQFFCSPTFSDLKLNELIEKTREKKAKAFYNEYYKNEPENKEKTMNIIIFTSKIRRDLSRKTDLTNLSKTSIMADTNKSSITTVNSIAKLLFNEITSSYSISNNNINNNNIKKKNSILKKNALNLRNENSNYIKKNIKLKDKLQLNINSSYKKSNIIYNKNNKILATPNHNTINSFSINNNTIEGNSKLHSFSIKKKSAVIKIKKDNNESSSTNTKLNSNRTYKELKKSSINYNNSGNNINLYNKLGNNTSSNIFKNNNNIIQKPKSRNYITCLGKNKSGFNYFYGNIASQKSFENNSLNNNNNFQSLNSLNAQSNGKSKVKKILRIHRNNMNISSHKINSEIHNYNNNESNGKKIEECNKISSINGTKYRNFKISNPYKKVSPYKKPGSICESINILKGIKNNIGKTNKIDHFKTVQAESRVSNVKTNWIKKDKQFYLKQKINSQYSLEKKK